MALNRLVHISRLVIILLATCGSTSSQAAEVGELSPLAEYIRTHCKNRLAFEAIAEFRQFVKKLREFAKEAGDSGPVKSNSLAELFKAGSDSNAEAKCLNEKETIYELDELIANYDTRRPCKMSEIAKLESFAIRHFFNDTKSIALRFFTLFGVNIGIKCKTNILAHLKQADMETDQLDFIYSMASPSGWNVLINEYAKKTMKFGTSSHADTQLINRIARLVPGLAQVEHLDYLNFNHPLNDQTIAARIITNGSEVANYQLEQGSKWRAKLVESLRQIISSCKNLDQFYVNSLLSLARLKELGLVVSYLADIHEHNVMLHKWLAATSFCQLMVRVELLDDGDTQSAIKLSICHDDEKFYLENRRSLYSYVSEFQEIDQAARENAWCASVPEGQWRQKSEAMLIHAAVDPQSVAMRQLRQFVKGLERTFESDDKNMI